MHKSNVCRYLVAEGFDHWKLKELVHLTQARHASLVKAATSWKEAQADTRTDGMVLHVITAADTLSGLAIQYGTTPQAILVANRMGMGHSFIHAHATLRIPTTNGQGQGSRLHCVTPTRAEVQWLARISTVDVSRHVLCWFGVGGGGSPTSVRACDRLVRHLAAPTLGQILFQNFSFRFFWPL